MLRRGDYIGSMPRSHFVLLGVAALVSCSATHTRTGDDNAWRNTPAFECGIATMDDVLGQLGPPTQIYEFSTKVVFAYFLVEERRSGYNVFVIKNTKREYLTDRAVYFFDRSGVLEEQGMSRVELPNEIEYRLDPWTTPVVEAGHEEVSE